MEEKHNEEKQQNTGFYHLCCIRSFCDGTCFIGREPRKTDADNGLNASDVRREDAKTKSYNVIIDGNGYSDLFIAGNDSFLAFDATKNTQFTKEGNTLFFDLAPADRTVLKVTDYIGSNTYNNLEDILYLLNDPTFVVSAK